MLSKFMEIVRYDTLGELETLARFKINILHKSLPFLKIQKKSAMSKIVYIVKVSNIP